MRRGARPRPPAAGGTARRRQLRPARQSVGPPSHLEIHRLPHLSRAGRARDRYLGHLRGLQLVFRPFHRPQGRRAALKVRQRLLDAGGPVYRRGGACGAAPALCALRHPSAEGRWADVGRRAVRGPVHPGHGDARDLQGRIRRTLAGAHGGGLSHRGADQRLCRDRHRRARGRGRRREDVQVQEERGRARRHIRPVRRGRRAPVRPVGLAART